jgi:hypothetical protein
MLRFPLMLLITQTIHLLDQAPGSSYICSESFFPKMGLKSAMFLVSNLLYGLGFMYKT